MCVHFLPCNTDSGAVRQMKKIVLGLSIVRHEAADEMDLPENAGIITEECTVLQDLQDVPNRCEVLFGLIYGLNLR